MIARDPISTMNLPSVMKMKTMEAEYNFSNKKWQGSLSTTPSSSTKILSKMTTQNQNPASKTKIGNARIEIRKISTNQLWKAKNLQPHSNP